MIEGKLTVAQTERLVTEALAGNIKHRRPIPVVRDVRLFFNTVNHAVETMRRSGIEARSEKNETDEYIEYTVRIPKKAACPKLVHTGIKNRRDGHTGRPAGFVCFPFISRR